MIAVAVALRDGSGIDSKAHIALAAAQDGELVDLLAETYAPLHCGDAAGAAGLLFDHRLK